MFTGVSGSGKSSLVFGTIAAESQRLINETYSAFVQGFMPTLARPDVDVLDGLTTAIIVDQQRMGGDPRSTVGTATDANAMLRILFSRLGQPHIGSPKAFSFNVASVSGAAVRSRSSAARARRSRSGAVHASPAACARGARAAASVSDIDLSQLYDEKQVAQRGRPDYPRLHAPAAGTAGSTGSSGFFDPDKPIRKYTKKERHDFLYHEPTRMKIAGINLTYEGLVLRMQRSMLSKDPDVDAAAHPGVRRPRRHLHRLPGLRRHPAERGSALVADRRGQHRRRVRDADQRPCRVGPRRSTSRRSAPLLAALRLHPRLVRARSASATSRSTAPSGTLSGGEAQRVKMVGHLGSSLTDVTYVFDEPTDRPAPARHRSG